MKWFGFYLLLFIGGLTGCKTSGPAGAALQDTVTAERVQSIDVGGETLHYIEQGTGDPVIFVHGTLGDYRTWMSRMQSYGEKYRVVSYSRRYAWPNEQEYDSVADYSVRVHADDLYAMIDKMGFDKVHLVGHSYGANTALMMALDHPERVRSLVLGEPAAPSILDPTNGEMEPWTAFMNGHLAPAAQAFRQGRRELGLERFMTGVMGENFRFDQVPEPVRQSWIDNLLELWGTALNPVLPELNITDIQSLNIPVLLLVGEASPTFLVDITHKLDRLLPNSQLSRIEDSSHGLYFEQPAVVDQLVLDFLARH